MLHKFYNSVSEAAVFADLRESSAPASVFDFFDEAESSDVPSSAEFDLFEEEPSSLSVLPPVFLSVFVLRYFLSTLSFPSSCGLA